MFSSRLFTCFTAKVQGMYLLSLSHGETIFLQSFKIFCLILLDVIFLDRHIITIYISRIECKHIILHSTVALKSTSFSRHQIVGFSYPIMTFFEQQANPYCRRLLKHVWDYSTLTQLCSSAERNFLEEGELYGVINILNNTSTLKHMNKDEMRICASSNID